MKWVLLTIFIGFLMVKDNIPFVKRGLANQTDNVLNIIIK